MLSSHMATLCVLRLVGQHVVTDHMIFQAANLTLPNSKWMDTPAGQQACHQGYVYSLESRDEIWHAAYMLQAAGGFLGGRKESCSSPTNQEPKDHRTDPFGEEEASCLLLNVDPGCCVATGRLAGLAVLCVWWCWWVLVCMDDDAGHADIIVRESRLGRAKTNMTCGSSLLVLACTWGTARLVSVQIGPLGQNVCMPI